MSETSWVSWLNRSRRVVLIGNVVSFVCILVVSAVLLSNVFKKAGEQLDENAKLAAQLLKVPAGNAIWNFDTQALEIIRKQTKSDLIDSVRFLDKDGKTVIEDEKVEVNYETFNVSEQVIDGKGEIGGSITVVYNKRRQWQAFVQEAQTVSILLGLAVLIQIGSVFGAVWSSGRMLKALNLLIDQIKGASEITLSQASGVSASAEKNLNLATTQASAVQRTVAAADEISAMMGHTSSRIEHSSGTAKESLEVVRAGVTNIERMTSTVREIENTTRELFESVGTSATKVEEIRSRMQLISDKTRVINDIVFLTKLLSFNASVEAARAGEHGRGFAVVAEEIGNLALMSGKASADIDQIIRDSLTFTKEITEELARELSGSIEKSRSCVSDGVNIASRSAELLKRIHTNIEALMADMQEVVRANEEQSAGIKSISSAMNEIDHATQASIESIRTTESAVAELMQQASVLAGMVSQASRKNGEGEGHASSSGSGQDSDDHQWSQSA